MANVCNEQLGKIWGTVNVGSMKETGIRRGRYSQETCCNICVRSDELHLQMHVLFFFHSLAAWQRQKRLTLPMCGTTSRSRRELFSPIFLLARCSSGICGIPPYIERTFLSAEKLLFPLMLGSNWRIHSKFPWDPVR